MKILRCLSGFLGRLIDMERCSPIEMRKNLQVVEQFKKAGIDFVAIPALNKTHKNELIEQGQKILKEAADE